MSKLSDDELMRLLAETEKQPEPTKEKLPKPEEQTKSAPQGSADFAADVSPIQQRSSETVQSAVEAVKHVKKPSTRKGSYIPPTPAEQAKSRAAPNKPAQKKSIVQKTMSLIAMALCTIPSVLLMVMIQDRLSRNIGHSDWLAVVAILLGLGLGGFSFQRFAIYRRRNEFFKALAFGVLIGTGGMAIYALIAEFNVLQQAFVGALNGLLFSVLIYIFSR